MKNGRNLGKSWKKEPGGMISNCFHFSFFFSSLLPSRFLSWSSLNRNLHNSTTNFVQKEKQCQRFSKTLFFSPSSFRRWLLQFGTNIPLVYLGPRVVFFHASREKERVSRFFFIFQPPGSSLCLTQTLLLSLLFFILFLSPLLLLNVLHHPYNTSL